jgi:hypothetical protein
MKSGFNCIAMAGLGAATLGVALLAPKLTAPALADPPVRPPSPETILPDVFCFRFTDIDAVAGDDDKFIFSFEVLNWTDTPAAGVRLSRATGGFDPIGDLTVAGAQIDANGREIGQFAAPKPGNQLFGNEGTVRTVTTTRIDYTATQVDIFRGAQDQFLTEIC